MSAENNKEKAAWKPGESGNPNGRPKGVPNKTTQVLKEAVILAAEQVGNDGAGKDGLIGYLRHVAVTDVKAFTGLLGRVIPLQVEGHMSVEHTSKEQKDAAVEAFMRADLESRSTSQRLQ
jgi:hypothetical protein